MQLIIENEEVDVKKGIRAYDLIRTRDDANDIYAIVLNGKLHDMNYQLKQGGILAYIYKDSETGRQIYQRSLHILFLAAVHRCFSDVEVFIEHSLSKGQYCELKMKQYVSLEDVIRIEQEMHKMVTEGLAIERSVVLTQEAVHYFEQHHMQDKAELLRNRRSKTCSLYQLDEIQDYFYGIMLMNTSYLTHFSLRYYALGIWLSPQLQFVDQPKVFHVFQEFEVWGKRIGVSNVSQLNQKILNGKMNELVLMSEAMVEKKLAELSSIITRDVPTTKIILIAGPSSVGKTTFSKRLSTHLQLLGKKPIAISMDNFYLNWDDCPRLADGTYDLEGIEALDLECFDHIMLELMHHLPVHLPVYNFKKGIREWSAKETQLDEEGIVIIEGIHGLNPKTCAYLPNEAVFKIYINALTHLNLDNHNPIPTRDYRLIRRIVRDYQFRGRGGAETIQVWNNVCRGEEKNIYPFQEAADFIFNSSMIYEMAILKAIATPLLNEITLDMPQHLEAIRLRKLLSYFVEGSAEAMPRNSILAEFVGNSIFDL